MRILRVFPRRTRATPNDKLVEFGFPGFFIPKVDEVHISVVFTYDLARAEKLAKAWSKIAPTKMGGPAVGTYPEEFVPGMYVKKGYVITSRGCPNKCWFCRVPKIEGGIRELSIKDGYNILDSNLLACSDTHIKNVFMMLSKQDQPADFTGGLEAARLKKWHVQSLFALKPKQLFFAYDTPDDLEPLVEAGKLLHSVGFKSHPQSHRLRAYVLCGHKNDTFEKAEKRMFQTVDAGFFPMAMLYRDEKGWVSIAWKKFQRTWAVPALIHAKIKRRNQCKPKKPTARGLLKYSRP